MAATTNYGWTKPTVGASQDTWGTEANLLYDEADADLRSVAGGLSSVVAADSSQTFALDDAGVLQLHTTAATPTFTIPPNSSVAFAVGTVIPIRLGNSAGNTTITPGSGVTLDFAGSTSASGSRTLTAGALASLTKVATDTWVISGVNVA